MCTWEDIRACLFMGAILDDGMSQSELTTVIYKQLLSFLTQEAIPEEAG